MKQSDIERALDILRKELPSLDAAAMPTKSETYVICGSQAGAVRDAIKTVDAVLRTSVPQPGLRDPIVQRLLAQAEYVASIADCVNESREREADRCDAVEELGRIVAELKGQGR